MDEFFVLQAKLVLGGWTFSVAKEGDQVLDGQDRMSLGLLAIERHGKASTITMSAGRGPRRAAHFSPAPPVAGARQSAGAKKCARFRRRLTLPGDVNTMR